MINIDSCKGILIVGYGTSGKSVFNFLKNRELNIQVFDDLNDNIPNKFDLDWSSIDLVIKSPAIKCMKHNCHEIIQTAHRNKIPVISTFDVFRVYNPKAKIIAITGTNGKSTTTALTHCILKHAGISVQLGGNIGIPYFDIPHADWYIFEMSSYELESSQYLDFEIACVLNIEPDHIEFHGNFDNYIKSKHKALDHAKFRLISFEDIYTMRSYSDSPNIIKISTSNVEGADLQIYENALFDTKENKLMLDLALLENLKGSHNHQNLEFAYAICKQIGLSPLSILKGIQAFQPLPHRLNLVRKINLISFVNDSKATNPISAAKALATYIGHKIYWLVGGRSKNVDPLPYVKPYLSSVQKIFLYGESMDEFENAFQGIKPTVRCKTLESAIYSAYKEALQDNAISVILLSPMCASFDQFKNFEERGEVFVKIVEKLS